MEIVWLQRALFDLNAIEDYIEVDNPAAARRVEQQIVETVSLLKRQPNMGRSGRVAGTRELIVPGTPYIVAYAVMAAKIVILAVIHGARKWPEVL